MSFDYSYSSNLSINLSANTNLTSLYCRVTKLSTLNLSANTTLTSLDCSYNNILTSLNVKNTNISSFTAYRNPMLTCIEVDNAAYSTTNWTEKDPTATFREDCSNLGNNDDFKILGITIFPNSASSILNVITNEKVSYKLLDINGKTLIKDVLDKGSSKINLLSLADGIYFLNLKTSKGSFIKKILIKS